MAIIDVSGLAAQLASADPPLVIDVRWRLNGPPGLEDYLAGHVPGAVFLDLNQDVCGTPGAGGRHPLPDPDDFEDALRAIGLRAGQPVVVYDGGESMAAARTWWTLRWAGHEQVTVLDGGYAAWIAAGQPVDTGEPPTRTPGDIEVHPGSRPVLDADQAEAVGAGAGVLLDARAAPRFRGETEPIDPVAGHIPGAVNLPGDRLTGPDGRLLPPDQLRAVFAGVGMGSGAEPVGAYCGSGVTAANLLLALTEAGYDDVALYVGSWSNWVDDPLRPIATGD